MDFKFTKFLLLNICLIFSCVTGSAQDLKNDSTKKENTPKIKTWRIEIEPSSYFFHGYSLQISKNITKNNRLNIGLYTIGLDVPKSASSKMFKNVSDDAQVKLGFEIAINTRYVIKIGKKETNPYIGLISGWEYLDITQPNLTKARVTTFIVTPYVGYEIYLYKQMLYLNPQIRAAIYIDSKNTDPIRTENLKPYFILPAIAIGVRL